MIGATLVGSAQPAQAARAATDPPQQVTVYLAPPDRTGLTRLAARRGLTRTDRATRLASLLPHPDARAEVVGQLRALGLTVVATGTWSVTVSAPASRITALFGSARSVRPAVGYAQGLPVIPAPLRGLVTLAVGGDETRPAFAHLSDAPLPDGQARLAGRAARAVPADAGYNGAQIRAAYGAPAGARRDGGPSPTVATLQLSGWDPADLTAYAAAAGVADPVASKQYVSVPLGRSASYDPNADGSGDGEVALDQEAVLGIAPNARQRAYIAPNTDAGFLAVFDKVRADAADPSIKIVALSNSWGLCEAQNAPDVVSTTETLLAALAAAGVTTFSASGDTGSDDCGDGGASVSYPASSPSVVAVGGTSLTSPESRPAESAWSLSGGGCSILFARPSWQTADPCAGKRSVPDISGVGDPGTGFAVYERRIWLASGGSPEPGWVTYGGTSLAAPATAAMLADVWSTNGESEGYGDIHATLYSAPASAFRDVVSGSNGTFDAGPGFDLVTGRGSPLWGVLGPLLATPSAAGYSLQAGVGTDRAVWAHRAGDSHFILLGGVATTVPSIVPTAGRVLYVVGGTDGNLWVRSDTSGWTLLGPVGTKCSGQAAAALGAKLYVGCRGSDGNLYVATTTVPTSGAVPAISGWTNYGGGVLEGAPAVAVVVGTVTWFVNHATGGYTRRTSTTGWRGEGAPCGSPGAGWSPNTAYLGCVARSGLSFAVSPFTGFGPVGGQILGVPGFVVNPDGSADVYVAGTDRALWTRHLESGATSGGWIRIGGQYILATAAALITP